MKKLCIKCKKRKDDRNMCKKLAEIHSKTPKDLIVGVPKIPVDIHQILQDLDIRCFCVNFSKLQKSLPIKNAKLAGMAYAHKNDLFIFYSDHSDYATARFTLAHELAHCCQHMSVDSSFHIELYTIPDILHVSGRPAKSFANRKEEEADKFARDLLIPTNVLVHILSKVGNPSIVELSELFAVPTYQMEKKLEEIRAEYGC